MGISAGRVCGAGRIRRADVGNKRALAQPTTSLHAHFLKQLMGFLGAAKTEQEFEERPLSNVMDTSEPVRRPTTEGPHAIR
jgi:hypothetical protein